jgi:ABC-type uncharacterized transport system auxiliary subunit
MSKPRVCWQFVAVTVAALVLGGCGKSDSPGGPTGAAASQTPEKQVSVAKSSVLPATTTTRAMTMTVDQYDCVP